MFDPISLIAIAGTAIINYTVKYAKEEAIGSIVGGIVGNRADAIGCKVLGRCWNGVKNIWTAGELPTNADLIRAIEEARLDATAYLGKAVMDELKRLYRETGNENYNREYRELKEYLPKWIKEQKTALTKTIEPTHKNPSFQKTEVLLAASEGSNAEELRNSLRQQVKESLVQELEDGLYMKLPPTFLSLLWDGWEEEGKQLEWFDIMTLKFSEILKDPKRGRVKEAFESRLLSDIKVETQEINLNTHKIVHLLEQTVSPIKDFIEQKWPEVENWMQELLEVAAETNERTKRIEARQEQFIHEVRNSISKKAVYNSEEVTQLFKKIEDLTGIAEEGFKEWEEYKIELETSPNSKSARKAYDTSYREWHEATEELQQAEKELAELKENIIRMRTVFNDIDLKNASERLKRAYDYFEAGEFKKVRELLEADERETERSEVLKTHEENAIRLQRIAEEDLVHSRSILLDINDANRFYEAEQIFQKSIDTYASFQNCFEYASFLQQQNSHYKAIAYYKRSILFLDTEEVDLKATALNNLGILLKDNNDDDSAKAAYEEALQIRRKLVAKDPNAHLPDVASTLNNLGNLLSSNNDANGAKAAYEEALSIYRQMAAKNPDAYLPNVAIALNNLGVLLRENNDAEGAHDAYEEALEIYSRFYKKNPHRYAFEVIKILMLFGDLHEGKKEKAVVHYEYAFQFALRSSELGLDVFDIVLNLVLKLCMLLNDDKEKLASYLGYAVGFLYPYREHPYYTEEVKIINEYLKEFNTDIESSWKEFVELEEQKGKKNM